MRSSTRLVVLCLMGSIVLCPRSSSAPVPAVPPPPVPSFGLAPMSVNEHQPDAPFFPGHWSFVVSGAFYDLAAPLRVVMVVRQTPIAVGQPVTEQRSRIFIEWKPVNYGADTQPRNHSLHFFIESWITLICNTFSIDQNFHRLADMLHDNCVTSRGVIRELAKPQNGCFLATLTTPTYDRIKYKYHFQIRFFTDNGYIATYKDAKGNEWIPVP